MVNRVEYAHARADWIEDEAYILGQRTGQLLFNNLPHEVANHVRGTEFDPFHKDMSKQEIIDWFNDHVIFSDGDEIIVLFNGTEILWERD